MKNKVNRYTGKTLREMTWEEIKALSRPITREEALRQMQEAREKSS